MYVIVPRWWASDDRGELRYTSLKHLREYHIASPIVVVIHHKIVQTQWIPNRIQNDIDIRIHTKHANILKKSRSRQFLCPHPNSLIGNQLARAHWINCNVYCAWRMNTIIFDDKLNRKACSAFCAIESGVVFACVDGNQFLLDCVFTITKKKSQPIECVRPCSSFLGLPN